MPNVTMVVVPAMVGVGYQIAVVSAHNIVVLVKPDGTNYTTTEEAQAVVDSIMPIAQYSRIEVCPYCPLDA